MLTTRQVFEQTTDQLGLQSLAEPLWPRTAPALSLMLTPCGTTPAPLGASRAGGRPDLPPGLTWPQTRHGTPLAFAAQINLAALPPHPLDLPASGHLYFFIGSSDDLDDVESAVIHAAHPTDPDPAPLVRSPPVDPAGHLDSLGLGQLRPCRLTARPAASVSLVDFNALLADDLSEELEDALYALPNAMCPVDGLQLGGFGWDVDAEPAAKLASQLGGHPSDWHLLLRLPSSNALGTLFWDWYAAGYYIRGADLRAKRFDRVHCLLLRD